MTTQVKDDDRLGGWKGSPWDVSTDDQGQSHFNSAAEVAAYTGEDASVDPAEFVGEATFARACTGLVDILPEPLQQDASEDDVESAPVFQAEDEDDDLPQDCGPAALFEDEAEVADRELQLGNPDWDAGCTAQGELHFNSPEEAEAYESGDVSEATSTPREPPRR